MLLHTKVVYAVRSLLVYACSWDLVIDITIYLFTIFMCYYLIVAGIFEDLIEVFF